MFCILNSGPVICGLQNVDFGNDTPSLGFFKQSTNEEINWTFKKEKTPSLGTGPASDHTTANGYYIYLEASSQKRGERVRMHVYNFLY